MEAMDGPRRLGGLIWVVLGAAATLFWLLSDGGTIGPVTTTLVLAYVAVAAVSMIAPGHPAAWWAARLGGGLLGLDFLAAVADRFGLVGEPGTSGVSWGSWGRFVDYTGSLTPWWPWPQVPAVTATIAEVVLGVLLLAGLWWRWVGKATAGLLFVYLVTMAIELGWAEVLTFAVPVLVGGALLASARGGTTPRRGAPPRTSPAPRRSAPGAPRTS